MPLRDFFLRSSEMGRRPASGVAILLGNRRRQPPTIYQTYKKAAPGNEGEGSIFGVALGEHVGRNGILRGLVDFALRGPGLKSLPLRLQVLNAEKLPGRLPRSTQDIPIVAISSHQRGTERTDFFCYRTSFMSGWNLLLKSVSWLEFATVHTRVVRVHSGIAIRPGQEKLWTERKDNRLSRYICF
jgi:hypothetical protein